MRLSELESLVPIRVWADGEFSALGKTAHQLPSMLVFLEARRFLAQVFTNSNISCVITNSELAKDVPARCGVAVAELPRDAFYSIHHHLATETDFYWKDFPAEIAADASVHPSAYVAPKNVKIGPRSRVEAGAIVLERCIIGEDVIIRSGAALGTEGYEFRKVQGRLKGVVHAGGLCICDRVEIQANCAIDRPIFGDFSVIGEDTKIDNLVHIGHRVKIGQRCMIVASAVICGNVTIGNDVWIGPRAVVSSGLAVGDGAYVTLGSVVVTDIPPGQRVTGFFAVDHYRFLDWMKSCWT